MTTLEILLISFVVFLYFLISILLIRTKEQEELIRLQKEEIKVDNKLITQYKNHVTLQAEYINKWELSK